MLTIKEIEALMPIIDAGIKATGMQIFRVGRAGDLQNALVKLQQIAQRAAETQAAQAQAAKDAAASAEAPPLPNGGADGEQDERREDHPT